MYIDVVRDQPTLFVPTCKELTRNKESALDWHTCPVNSGVLGSGKTGSLAMPFIAYGLLWENDVGGWGLPVFQGRPLGIVVFFPLPAPRGNMMMDGWTGRRAGGLASWLAGRLAVPTGCSELSSKRFRGNQCCPPPPITRSHHHCQLSDSMSNVQEILPTGYTFVHLFIILTKSPKS